MATKRDGLKENRESFEDARKKAAFEREVDAAELHAAEKKLGEEVKRHRRDHK